MSSPIPAGMVYNRKTGVFIKAGEAAEKQPRVKHSFLNLVFILIGLTGICLIAYPTLSNWWNTINQSREVASYLETVADADQSGNERLLEEAEAYNQELSETGILWGMSEEQEKRYNSLLNVDNTGIMGYINIPKVSIELPIYHGTDEAVLQVAIGHLEGTSLPVGGPGTHCVVSGHRGLPSARLFTDIDQLAEGDTFTLTVLNRTVTYEVDQIHVVEPSDVSDIQIEEGKDFCTLVTCTPYGINTHRLLVRGHRVENAPGETAVIADAVKIDGTVTVPAAAVLILLLLALWFIAGWRRRKKLNAILYQR